MSEYVTSTSKQAEVVLVWDVEKNERSLHSCQIAQFRNVRKNGVLIHDGLKNAQRFMASEAMVEAVHIMLEDSGPLQADDLSRGMVISQEAFDALCEAFTKAEDDS